jgi:TolB-like protein
MPPRTPDRPSLAVLPFKAGIPSVKNDLFAAGVATEIISELARNRDLRSIARDSSFTFGGHELSPREIGERLHVRYLVDGTAQRMRETLTVAVQLIDSLDGVVAQFNRAIELDPSLPVSYQGLSRTVTFKGDVDQALRLIRRALELGPGDADNMLFLGTVLHQKGDSAGAVRAAEDAIDLNLMRPVYYSRHCAEILWGPAATRKRWSRRRIACARRLNIRTARS